MIGLRRTPEGAKPVLILSHQVGLWQDVGKTTPGVINSPVGNWQSLRNGYEATQATAASKPTLLADGLSFDGGDYLNVPIVFSTGQPYTFRFWVYDNSNTNTVTYLNILPSDRLYISWVAGTIYVGDGVTNIIAFVLTRPIATWYHLCLSFDGTTYRLFKDGVQVASSTTLLQSITTSSLQIGGRTSISAYHNGRMGDIEFWNKALHTTTFTPPVRSGA